MKLLRGSYSCISLIMGVGLVASVIPTASARSCSDAANRSRYVAVIIIVCCTIIGKTIEPRQGDEWAVASEDCAFGPIGFERVRDVRPGEMIIISPEGKLQSRQVVCQQHRADTWLPHSNTQRQGPNAQLRPCIFEYIYLARPDSVLNNISVYNFQLGLGTRLARRIRYARCSKQPLTNLSPTSHQPLSILAASTSSFCATHPPGSLSGRWMPSCRCLMAPALQPFKSPPSWACHTARGW